MTAVVPEELDGARADRAIASMWEVSRGQARKTIDAGKAERGGVALRPSDRVTVGDELVVAIAVAPVTFEAEDIPFGVAYEDDDVLVVDKPAGLVVHPGAGNASGTLANGLLARFDSAGELGPDRRWGIVHRLDRDTSGLLIVAKTAGAQATLQDALRAREISRHYLTLVAGRFDATTGTIEAPIGRDPSNPTRMAVTSAGRPARTHYRVSAAWDDQEVSLLSVELETGRTHQIRVHLRAIDHPVVGDPVYGPRRPVSGDPGRTWLHAAELEFAHPSRPEDVVVQAPLPQDLVTSLQQLGPPNRGAIPG
ncbi:MAG: RluA family pseudouridine synthase [Acidimicrobiia bacterium]|nr:MAG: RluA family pseudouridine synthase [Acidimicrobiia bacterium]